MASPNSPDSLVSSFDADKAMIERMGYDASDMVECGDNYLVGEDLIFSKANLLEYRQSPQLEPLISFGETLNEKSQKIFLSVNNTDFTSSVGQTPYMIQDAIKAWNEIGECNLNICSSYDANPDMSRYYVNLHIGNYSDQIGGKGVFMKYEPGKNSDDACKTLYINTDCREWEGCWTAQGVFLIMHGLGHVFKLNDVESDGVNSGSIMVNHGKLVAGKDLWSGFTNLDKTALREKYPVFSDPNITYTCQPKAGGMDGDWMNVGTTYKVTTNYTNPVIPNPVYSYVISKLDSNVQYEFSKNADNSFNLKFTAYGACKVTTNISQNGVVKNSYEQVYYGIADKFEYPSTVSIGAFFDFKWTYWTPDSHDINTQFSVKEKLFDNNTDRSVTMERVNNNQVRIRFNDYGSYEVAVECRSGSTVLSRRTFYFTKLFRPACSLHVDSAESGSYDLPSYATEPTGLHPLVTYKCSAHFATLRERVVCDVNMKYEQHTMLFRRVDRRTLDGAPVRVVLNRGASSHHALPDLYDMYDPSFANYEFNSKFVYQYYTDVTYPEEDGAGVR